MDFQSIVVELQDDGTVSSAFNSLPIESLADPQDLTFPPVPTISTLSGTVSLPAGEVADGDMEVRIILRSDDFSFFAFQAVTIPDQASQVDYSFIYPELSARTEVELQFNCESFSSNCDSADGGLETVFYLQDDGTASSAFNSLPIESLADQQDLTFPPVPTISTLSGTVSLPAGEVADGDMFITVQISDVGDTFTQLQFVSILDQTSQVEYSLDYPESSSETEVDIIVRCESSNCGPADGNNRTSFFLQDDGSLSGERNTFTIADVPDTQNFIFPSIKADMFEEDNTAETASSINANVTQNRTIHEPGDVDWVSFSVLEGDSKISITANSEGSNATPLTLTLHDSELMLLESGHDQPLSQAELDDQSLLSINPDILAAGDYFIKVEGLSASTQEVVYELKLEVTRELDSELCFPVVTQSGGASIICL